MIGTGDESKLETFSVYKKVNIGDINQDIYYLGDIESTIDDIESKVTHDYGRILSLDTRKKEIVVVVSPKRALEVG